MGYLLAFFAVGAYLLGSIPFGKLIAAYVAHVDITRRGSGNIGATNVAREVGMKWGIITLVLDTLKGLAPVGLFSWWASSVGAGNDLATAGIALSALLGHMFPLFLRFHGGKGVATALGAYLAISPLSCLFGLTLFVLVVVLWDFISLGSITAACAMPIFLVLVGRPAPFVLGSAVMAILISWKHRENIRRLLRGEEPRWRKRGS